LLEVLVALVVLGLLVTLLGSSVDFVSTSWHWQERAIQTRGELEPTDRAIRGLIERMEPGVGGWSPVIDGGPHTFAFVTDLSRAPGRQAEVAIGVDGGHRLIVHWRPKLAVAATVQTNVLLEGVERLDIQYWRQDGSVGGAWLDTWKLHALPALVRFRIVFQPGDPRRWPDLIVAPQRIRPVTKNTPILPIGIPA
jgi:hypothetical protein